MKTPAIEIKDLWLSFRGNLVLEDVNLTLPEGEFLGIIGPNGAGKSVLMKILLGLLRPDRGTVLIFGSPPAETRGEIGYVPQFARFDTTFPMSVLDVVLMGRLSRARLLRPFGREDREKAMEALEQVYLADLASRQIGKLSGGQLQRVLIARALVVEARLLLLDEPSASLDPKIGGELYDILGKLLPERTIVLISHEIGVISSHVDSIACLNRRLYHHPSGEVTSEIIEEIYGCPVDFLVHSHTHRVLDEHGGDA